MNFSGLRDEGSREVRFKEGAEASREERELLLGSSLPKTIKASMYEISLILQNSYIRQLSGNQ